MTISPVNLGQASLILKSLVILILSILTGQADGTLRTHMVVWTVPCPLLSLSGACQEDVAASASVRHAGLSQARRALPTPGQN